MINKKSSAAWTEDDKNRGTTSVYRALTRTASTDTNISCALYRAHPSMPTQPFSMPLGRVFGRRVFTALHRPAALWKDDRGLTWLRRRVDVFDCGKSITPTNTCQFFSGHLRAVWSNFMILNKHLTGIGLFFIHSIIPNERKKREKNAFSGADSFFCRTRAEGLALGCENPLY